MYTKSTSHARPKKKRGPKPKNVARRRLTPPGTKSTAATSNGMRNHAVSSGKTFRVVRRK